MKNRNRDLLVLLKAASFSGEAFEKHINELHKVLVRIECADSFCTAHELATRTRITGKKKKILRAIESAALKPFHFLINKN